MNKPKEYVQGWVEFYKLKFAVNTDVLIPRPETELLVDEVLNYLKTVKTPQIILDLGTGAGAIAVAIAVNMPKKGHKIVATEVSAKALEVAKKNAKLHGVLKHIQFLVSDLLDNPELKDLNPDVIVTNLPYIPSERIAYLDSSVKDYEPHVALDGGQDGFQLYLKFFKQVNDLQWTPKLILGEIDYTHGELAQSEAIAHFPKSEVEVKLDLFHRQRILIITG